MDKENPNLSNVVLESEEVPVPAFTVIEREDLVLVLKNIIDPEIYIDIWTLGLIYDVQIDGDIVNIRMTFTSMACPAGPYLVEEVRSKLLEAPGVARVNVEIVFEPPWQPSEELKALMGIG